MPVVVVPIGPPVVVEAVVDDGIRHPLPLTSTVLGQLMLFLLLLEA